MCKCKYILTCYLNIFKVICIRQLNCYHPSLHKMYFCHIHVLYRGFLNRGTPKSSILVRFSIINHPTIGVAPWLWKPPYKLDHSPLWSNKPWLYKLYPYKLYQDDLNLQVDLPRPRRYLSVHEHHRLCSPRQGHRIHSWLILSWFTTHIIRAFGNYIC